MDALTGGSRESREKKFPGVPFYDWGRQGKIFQGCLLKIGQDRSTWLKLEVQVAGACGEERVKSLRDGVKVRSSLVVRSRRFGRGIPLGGYSTR